MSWKRIMLGCLLEMCVSKMDPVYTRPGKVRNEEPRIATFTRVRLYFVFCSASLRLSLFFHFLAAMFLESHRRRHFSLFFMPIHGSCPIMRYFSHFLCASAIQNAYKMRFHWSRAADVTLTKPGQLAKGKLFQMCFYILHVSFWAPHLSA